MTSIQLISALLVRVIQLSMVRLALVLMGVMWCPPSSSKVLASWPGPVLRWIELPERRRWRMVWIRVVAIRWGEDDTESADNLVVEGGTSLLPNPPTPPRGISVCTLLFLSQPWNPSPPTQRTSSSRLPSTDSQSSVDVEIHPTYMSSSPSSNRSPLEALGFPQVLPDPD